MRGWGPAAEVAYVQEKWDATNRALKVKPEIAAREWRVLEAQYTDATRAYHTMTHIHSMLLCAESAARQPDDPHAVFFATLFHDAVYDPRASDNEERSAAQWVRYAEEAGLQPFRARVQDWILQTKRHMDCPSDAPYDKRFFLDCDLCILGMDAARYRTYAKQIRFEYGHYEEADYRKGRAKVLQGFLDKRRLFFTPEMEALFEAPARRNLEAEIKELLDPNPPRRYAIDDQ